MLFLNIQILGQKYDFPARARARGALLFFNHQATKPKPMDLNMFSHKYDWIDTSWAP